MTLAAAKDIYSQLVSTAWPTSGFIFDSSITINFTQHDLNQGKNVSFLQNFKEVDGEFKSVGFPVASESAVLTSYNKKDGSVAYIKTVSQPSDKDVKYAIEIWNSKGLVKSIPTLDKHKQVYKDEWFGSFRWSPNSKYLVYVAERNPPKTASFFEQDPTKDTKPGEKFEYKETWGETYDGQSNPTPFIVDIEAGIVIQPEGVPENLSTGQALWAPDNSGIVFTGWSTETRRLGIIHCFQRPSSLYYLPVNIKLEEEKEKEKNKDLNKNKENEQLKSISKVVKLTGEDYSIVRCPRFSHNGEKLIFLSPPNGMKTHGGCSRLCVIDWKSKDTSVVVDVVKKPKPKDFPGIYTGNLLHSCFLDDDRIIFTNAHFSDLAIYSVNIQTKSVKLLKLGSQLLDVYNGKILVFSSSPNLPYTVEIAKSKLNDYGDLEIPTWTTVDSVDKNIPIVKELISKVKFLTVDVPVKDSLDFQYILISPVSEKEELHPIIVTPHGGPHGVYFTSFIINRAFFALLGYHVLLVNYRGSTGFGQDFVEVLAGHVGEYDIQDCIAALDDALSKNHNIDKDKIVYWGASHGGFIGGHLIARESRLKAAVLFNPVTNISSMYYTTDIPDWCLTESGANDEQPYTVESQVKMFNSSPMSYIDKVKVPTLFILGQNDRRVPISQGIAFYNALRSKGIETRMLSYPGEYHGITDKPEHQADFWINSHLWFQKYISATK